jgi:hypothetical protein
MGEWNRIAEIELEKAEEVKEGKEVKEKEGFLGQNTPSE